MKRVSGAGGRRWLIAGLIIGLLLGLGAGAVARSGMPDPSGIYGKLNIFSRVLAYIQNNYVEPVDNEKLVYSAIRGMVGTLDPYSVFLTPDQYKDMKEDTSGEFGGLGVEVTFRNEYPTVISPIEDSPAARAGLKPDDQIVEVEGIPTRGMDIYEVKRLLKGPPGSKVNLRIKRLGWNEARLFTFIREQIRNKSVDYRMLEPGYGYIRIKSFQEHTFRQVEDALGRLNSDSGGTMKGLVMDLRNDPGGLFEQSVRISDLFLSEGVIVSTGGRGQKEETKELAHPKGTQPRYPMAVLVNGGSASASEIVAGALQDHKRAVIVGTPSYGKGSVQTIIELDDHSALKLTIAKYYTPNHRSIQDQGIQPDVEVEEEYSSGGTDGGTPKASSMDGGSKQIFEGRTGDIQLKIALEQVKKSKK